MAAEGTIMAAEALMVTSVSRLQTNELHTERLPLGADTQVPDISCPQDHGLINF